MHLLAWCTCQPVWIIQTFYKSGISKQCEHCAVRCTAVLGTRNVQCTDTIVFLSQFKADLDAPPTLTVYRHPWFWSTVAHYHLKSIYFLLNVFQFQALQKHWHTCTYQHLLHSIFLERRKHVRSDSVLTYTTATPTTWNGWLWGTVTFHCKHLCCETRATQWPKAFVQTADFLNYLFTSTSLQNLSGSGNK